MKKENVKLWQPYAYIYNGKVTCYYIYIYKAHGQITYYIFRVHDKNYSINYSDIDTNDYPLYPVTREMIPVIFEYKKAEEK